MLTKRYYDRVAEYIGELWFRYHRIPEESVSYPEHWAELEKAIFVASSMFSMLEAVNPNPNFNVDRFNKTVTKIAQARTDQMCAHESKKTYAVGPYQLEDYIEPEPDGDGGYIIRDTKGGYTHKV
jgi:hypothetical protein